jgi:hypothetical protein
MAARPRPGKHPRSVNEPGLASNLVCDDVHRPGVPAPCLVNAAPVQCLGRDVVVEHNEKIEIAVDLGRATRGAAEQQYATGCVGAHDGVEQGLRNGLRHLPRFDWAFHGHLPRGLCSMTRIGFGEAGLLLGAGLFLIFRLPLLVWHAVNDLARIWVG